MHGCDHSAYSRSQISQRCHPLFLSCKIRYPRVFYLFTSAIENPEVSNVVLTELCGSAYYSIGSSSFTDGTSNTAIFSEIVSADAF